MAISDNFALIGFTGGNLAGSPDLNGTWHGRFNCEGNLPEITKVMQNLPELRGNCQRYEEPARQNH